MANFASTDHTRDQLLERPLPHSAESERAILGGVLLDNGLVNQAIELLQIEDFYVGAHRRIFQAMIALSERGSEINPILVGEELRREGYLEQAGGITGVAELTYGLPHFSNIAHYAKVVKDKSLMRQLVKVANKVISDALEEEDEAEIVLDRAEQMIFALADERTRQGFIHIKQVAESMLEKAESMTDRNTFLTGLTTGFNDLDVMTSGLQPSDLIIIAARPSMGKCLAYDSEIVLADGEVRTIEEIYRTRQANLLTLANDYRFKSATPSDFIDDGIKPVYRVTTRLGRTVETTLSHPFLTIDGWRPLHELKTKIKIAVPRVIDSFSNGESMRECEIKLLAYLIGDGCLTNATPIFTVGKPALEQDFIDAVTEFGGVESVPSNSPQRTFALRVRRKSGERENRLTVWLKSLGIYGCNSHKKFVPPEVFKLRRDLVALFLNRLFSTDGWASVLTSGQSQVGYASVSERLARQVQHLLLRFGVIASLKKRAIKYKDERRTAWQLDITDAHSIERFVKEIGIYGKEEALCAVTDALNARCYQTNRDLIPIEIWERLSVLKAEESWSAIARRAGIKGHTNIHANRRAPTRERLLTLSSALNDRTLEQFATSEVYWDEIVSIEYAGDKQVYDLTIPETHNFVANDICVHNTALCLTLAQNAAIHAGAVVGIFSLEMSKESLVTRMLCSEGRVDSQRFRNGFLARDEWARLSHALGTLSEAKIFIDDTPGISVLEMRAKVRRLAAEQKRLDLIIVDYMQLMSGGARRTESRQQEVSQISRELKGLAKEMSTPLVALSQLSRAPEARTSHRPQLSDLRESGCIAGETLVTLADTGAQVAVRELVGKKDFAVWALNEKDFRIERAVVSRAFATGRKPVFLLKTRLGLEIRATGNHKFRAFDGWRRLDELKIGERLALPRQINCTGAQTISDAEAALLGHLIGDGCTLPRHVTQYTTRERDLAETVATLSTEMFGDEVKPRINVERQWLQVYLTSARRHTHGVHSPVTEWLTALGVYGLRSHEKRVPAQMFEQPQETIAVFLRHLWATDGCIHLSANTAHYPAVYYATSSVDLARGVQSLLLRFGINARLSRHAQQGRGRDQFHVNVTGRKNIERFLERIGTVGERRAASREAILKYLSEHPARASRDVLPREAWRSEVVPAMSHTGITSRQLQAALGTSYCGSTLYASNLSRTRAALVAQIVSSESLRALAESDVYWDEIASIEPDGETDVYDLTVPRYRNFIANNIIIHNSIEQDADLVAFIYREEQYNRSEENEGVAEIIIAKQRNGPTGDVKLAFLKEFTRFENMWRE